MSTTDCRDPLPLRDDGVVAVLRFAAAVSVVTASLLVRLIGRLAVRRLRRSAGQKEKEEKQGHEASERRNRRGGALNLQLNNGEDKESATQAARRTTASSARSGQQRMHRTAAIVTHGEKEPPSGPRQKGSRRH